MVVRLLNYVVRRRAVVGLVTLASFLAAILYVVITGPRYVSQALLLQPVEATGEGVLSGFMEKLNLPAVVSPGTAGSTSAAILGDLLTSRRLGELVIKELSLKEHFRTKSLEYALRELRGRTGVAVSETGLIRLSVSDRDRQYALKIARAYITELDSLNRFLQYTRAEQTQVFMASQLARYRAQIQRERGEIASFQRENNIVNLDEQVRGAIDVATDIKVRMVLAGIERDLLKEFTQSSSLELKRKAAEYNDLTDQLRGIMNGDSAGVVFVPLKHLPALAQRFAAMQRDLEVDEHVYSYILERYEQAGIERTRTTPVVQVVDEPSLPEKPSGTRRWLVVAMVTVVGFLWICAVIAWWGWVTNREKSSEEERALADITSAVRADVEWLRGKLRF